MLDLALVKKIYFIGVGGIGMSAVAGIARSKGFEVSGSDDFDIYEPAKGVLDRSEINYKIGYNSRNFPAVVDLVVTSAAISETNPELRVARDRLIPVVSFAELLAILTADKKQIVVVGAHGKGTTSGLISFALKGLERSGFFVGAVLNNLKTNYFYGEGSHFVIEGDEYKANFNDPSAKFSYYNPSVLLINNIEWDHPDLYPSPEDFKKPFEKLVKKMTEHSLIVYNADDKNVLDVVKGATSAKIGFGFSASAEIRAEKPVFDAGNFRLKISRQDKNNADQPAVTYITQLPGMPYAYDILAAVSVLTELGHSSEEISKYVQEYTGVKRRYEIIYTDGITIIDDYAHHATAVKQTLEATREKFPNRRIICFFEPHTYSRTKETIKDLALAFGSADLVFISEVYPAREQRLATSITGQEVVAAIKTNQPNVRYVANKGEALKEFNKIAKTEDVYVVMAVGSFNTLVYDLQDAWQAKNI